MIGHDDPNASLRFRLLDPAPPSARWHEETEETFTDATPPTTDRWHEETEDTFPDVAPPPPAAPAHMDESDELFEHPAVPATAAAPESAPQAAPEPLAERPAQVASPTITERPADPDIARLRDESAARIAAAERMEREALARRRAAEDRQSESWAIEQQRRFTERLDEMLAAEAAAIAERTLTEKDRLSVWGQAERTRIQAELATEEQRFHDRLLRQLEEFEFQLGERLREQEERMGRWIAEAERIVGQRTGPRRP